MKKLLIASSIALSIGLLAGCSDDATNNEKSKETQENQTKIEKENVLTEEEKVSETESAKENNTTESEENTEYKTEVADLYNRLNNEYEKQKNNYDEIAWAQFAREFKKDTEELREEIGNSDMMLSIACGDMLMLADSYREALNGNADDNYINTVTASIEDAIK